MKPDSSCVTAVHLSYFTKLRVESKGRKGIHPCSPPAVRIHPKKKRFPDERIREADALMYGIKAAVAFSGLIYSAINVMLTEAEIISFAACTIVPYPVPATASSMRLAEKLPTPLS